MNLDRRIRTILYDDQPVASDELDLLHTPALQRLYDLHQLGLTDRVFIDASHSRLHHVLGVMHQVDKLMSAIEKNLLRRKTRHLSYSSGRDKISIPSTELADLVRRRKSAARLMGLLHDLPHAPFGHTLEDEIELVSEKHDEPQRQADAFYRLVLQYLGWILRDADKSAWGIDSRGASLATFEAQLASFLDSPHLAESPPQTEDFLKWLIQRGADLAREPQRAKTSNEQPPVDAVKHAKPIPRRFRRFLKDLAFATRALVYLDLVHKRNPNPKHIPADHYPVDRLLRGILTEAGESLTDEDDFVPQRDAFLLDVIGNTICADLLDYAKRDSVLAGLKLDYDANRIIENFTLTTVSESDKIQSGLPGDVARDNPFAGKNIRTAISLFSHKLRIDVPGELLNLLQVRFYVYQRMLFHPTKCIAGAMLGSAIQQIGWAGLPPHMRFVGDAVFLYEIGEAARLVRDLITREAVIPGQLYDRAFAGHLAQQIVDIPQSGVMLAAAKLIEDRVPSVRRFAAAVAVRACLRGNDNGKKDRADAADLLSRLLEDKQYEALTDLTPALLAQFKAAVSGRSDVSAAVRGEARTLLDEAGVTAVTVREEIKAGLRVLDRLMARRYHKAVFRLLQDAKVDGLPLWNGGEDEETAATAIAKKFLNPVTRMSLERAIERDAKLPHGTVAIHCPLAEGPRKIADILVCFDDGPKADRSRAVPLRHISAINKDIFGEHEKAVKALEKMYQSMWRLVVSVAPPFDREWEKINEVVGTLLLQVITNGRETDSAVPNDETMVRELQHVSERWAAADDEAVKLIYPDGRQQDRNLYVQRFMDRVQDAVTQSFPLKSYFDPNAGMAAVSSSPDQAERTVARAYEHFNGIWTLGVKKSEDQTVDRPKRTSGKAASAGDADTSGPNLLHDLPDGSDKEPPTPAGGS